ncbi:hypothetical protein D9619_002826 [Psilocybe cf. subviscida]|uniref:FAD-binding domain-containing protein n=1 Tax=Psilocybe cf. subviscida TaxID=2480587 RepID=A0A8H5EUU6_9AGAR|nr:hypothetical protein D9619_002826 [Psilocybe cf. subviscida]
MTTTSKNFDIAIVGGGLCGISIAVALSRAGVKVKVFEATSRYEEVGAGVGLGSNAIRALHGLGLMDAVLARIKESKANKMLFTFIAGEGDHERIFDYADTLTSGPDGKEGLAVYRPAYLEALIPLLDPSVTAFNKRLKSLTRSPSGRQILHFTDGTTHETDLVIGADGIKSTSRIAVVGEGNNNLGFSNTYAYRGLVPVDALLAAGVNPDKVQRPLIWTGIAKHFVSFPMNNNKIFNLVAFHRPIHDDNLTQERPPPWVETVPHQDLLDAYKEWGNDARIILEHITEPSRWSIHTLYPPLKSYVKGNVVLVGDSAHGMLPHLGAGVGQGFEDVYVLYRLLTLPETKMENLETILATYDKLRVPRANAVLERSIVSGNIYDNYGPKGYDAKTLEDKVRGQWEWVWDHDLEAQVNTAVAELRTVLSTA